jgi:hypothetical protein
VNLGKGGAQTSEEKLLVWAIQGRATYLFQNGVTRSDAFRIATNDVGEMFKELNLIKEEL